MIDDDESFRTALTRYLSAQGWDCVAVESGSDGCHAARASAFDIALVDCWMPNMSGFETLHALCEADPLLPVILLSAMGTEATAHEAVRQGAVEFIHKSEAPSEIAIAIARLVHGSRTRRRMDEAVGGTEPSDPRGTILLVDDHEGFRKAAARSLRRAGFSVKEADCGSTALDVCDKNMLDGAIIDLHLPDTNGIEVARVIRSLRTNMPVVLISGEANQEEKREALNHGITGCIDKLSSVERLATVAKVLVEESRRSRLREAREKLPPEPLQESLGRRIRVAYRDSRRWFRKTEARVYVMGLATAALIAVSVLSAVARYEQRQFDAPRSVVTEKASLSPFEMYDRIGGYLERDEKRELASQERR